MGARMLGPEVDGEGVLPFVRLEGAERPLVLVGDGDLLLAQGIEIDPLVEKEVGHVGVTVEQDAVKLADLPFVPGGAVEDRPTASARPAWRDRPSG